jgi:hypothetical protein
MTQLFTTSLDYVKEFSFHQLAHFCLANQSLTVMYMILIILTIVKVVSMASIESANGWWFYKLIVWLIAIGIFLVLPHLAGTGRIQLVGDDSGMAAFGAIAAWFVMLFSLIVESDIAPEKEESYS